MKAFARFKHPDCRHGGDIYIGPEAYEWGCDYEWSVGFYVEDGDIAVLTGKQKIVALDGTIRKFSEQDHAAMFWALDALGLRPAYRRKYGTIMGPRIMAARPSENSKREWAARPSGHSGNSIMDTYEAKITMEVTKNGEHFTSVTSSHPNLSYDAMHGLQRHLSESLLSLGDTTPAKKK